MQFNLGERYTSEEIQSHLEVGNAGGIRVALKGREVKRVVLLTVVPSAKVERENPYHDRVEGDVLVYSAAGLQGDQSLGGMNKRIPEQPKSSFPIYGFRLNQSRRKAEAKRWEFLGLLQFLRVSPTNQIDREGSLRRVWIFELRICSEFISVPLAQERALTQAAIESSHFESERESRGDLEETKSCAAAFNAEEIERTRARIFAMSPRGFELLVQRALETTGFNDVSVTKYTQDNGIDVNARVAQEQWPIAGLRIQLQVKRWMHTVGRREVAQLRGSLEPFAQGAVVTTSFFSRAAISEARAIGRQPIVLVDGYHFAQLVNAKQLAAG